MTDFYLAAGAAIFITGFVIGIVIVICLGIREERGHPPADSNSDWNSRRTSDRHFRGEGGS